MNPRDAQERYVAKYALRKRSAMPNGKSVLLLMGKRLWAKNRSSAGSVKRFVQGLAP